MKIAGLDIGTTGCKVTVFDEKGGKLDSAYCDYPSSRASTGHTVDAGKILEGVFTVLGKIAVTHPDIAGLGVTSFGETFVLTDENGVPLHPAMLYTDPRGCDQCAALCKALGSDRIIHITGVKPHEMYSLPKLLWIKENQPEVYARAKHIFLMEDLVVFALTGNAQIDYSLACRTMAFDIGKLAWSDEILAAAGIKKALFSKTVPTGTSAGHILPAVAEKTGLSPEMQVISVSHDQISAAVGAGAFSSDVAVDGAGTVECLTPIFDKLPDLRTMSRGNFAVVPYVVPGKYVCYAFSYTGGALISWCIDNIAKAEKAEAAGCSVNALLESRSQSPTGLLVLPHFAGAATPYMDTGSKGAVVGLTVATTAADIYRGCMEGVVYEMLLNREALGHDGDGITMLYATGGGARSEVWMQMKADVLDLPVTALATVDAGTVGSAMLTGIAVGCFRDLTDAAAHMVEKVKTYYPDPAMHEKYMTVYQRYRGLYHALRPLV